ncbi:type III secretion system outer membrane ring subunit SctC [Pantoea sp. 18069]|uniref:type III secretion system outer membrane ring subunit SctC n=1 Tax=Pantoea sp. 18069 TaxID=2681415 RepID=UPI0013585C36|nr:type III secretion system outer membrane ring subunit SctC [Pantoea sp. 18069]
MTLSPFPSHSMPAHSALPTPSIFPAWPRRTLRALACAGVFAASWTTAQAGPPPWTEAAYSYYANNASMAQVLGDFASSFSLSLDLSPQATGKVHGKFNSASPTEFIDRLASVYGLTWFTHAGTLYVGRTTEVATRSISAGGGNIATVRQALLSLGVLDARFGWGELPEQGIALVSGPAAYVALIERTMAQLPVMAGGQQVAVFRLKHASVDDRTILYRDRQITTPGLAQVLRNLIGGQSGGSGVNNALISSVAPGQGLPGLPGMASAANTVGLAFDPYSSGLPNGPFASANGTANATGAQTGAAAGQMMAGGAGAGMRRPAPSIQADSRLNAIIVQDTAERMPLYRSLIEQLDIPSPLIEIEAMIIDINSSRLDELGIAWNARRGGTVAGFGSMATKGDGNDLVLGSIARGASVDPTSLVVSSGNFLINRIRALEGTGEAHIQSRPSILTIDNIGALLDLSETFYIRSIGERVATITPITAGTTLRVTPHYVERAEGPVIQLDVDIEDGQIQNTEIDSLPTVRRSVVSTQAIVGEGQTLLIGGYKSTQSTRDVNKVPGLGSIPVFGLLFSNKIQNEASRERLFMIKPRLVTLPTGVAADVNALREPVPMLPMPAPVQAEPLAPMAMEQPSP